MSLIKSTTNNFGGNWTYRKVKIIEDYAKAYLQIMKNRPYWRLLYFDGFAGSGEISIDGPLDSKVIEGAAKKIVAIKEPKMFDICKNTNNSVIFHFVRASNNQTAVRIANEIIDQINTPKY